MAAIDHFAINAGRLAELKARKPWLTEPKYFKRARINAGAAMKMTTHAEEGVQKGLRGPNGMPVEVMGLLLGHLSTEEPGTIVVTDAFPLPVEGTETMVLTDKPEVVNYMIALGEALEKTRGGNFMGWYHSHPFDVGPHSNAFLSATDVGTQLSWQMQEDGAGNPWLALVVDPLRGVAKGKPEIGAFRCYPPTYTPPKGLAPDGVTWTDERARNARWGESCVSYYCMDVDYVTPPLSAALLGILSRDFLWARVLSETPGLAEEARAELPGKLAAVASKVDTAASTVSSTVAMYSRSSAAAAAASGGSGSAVSGYRASMGLGLGLGLGAASAGGAGRGSDGSKGSSSVLSAAVKLADGVDAESCRCHSAQTLKAVVFNLRQRKEEREAAAAAAGGRRPASAAAAAAGGAGAGAGAGEAAASSTASEEAGSGAGAASADAAAAPAGDAASASVAPAAGAAMATDAVATAGLVGAAAGTGSSA